MIPEKHVLDPDRGWVPGFRKRSCAKNQRGRITAQPMRTAAGDPAPSGRTSAALRQPSRGSALERGRRRARRIGAVQVRIGPLFAAPPRRIARARAQARRRHRDLAGPVKRARQAGGTHIADHDRERLPVRGGTSREECPIAFAGLLTSRSTCGGPGSVTVAATITPEGRRAAPARPRADALAIERIISPAATTTASPRAPTSGAAAAGRRRFAQQHASNVATNAGASAKKIDEAFREWLRGQGARPRRTRALSCEEAAGRPASARRARHGERPAAERGSPHCHQPFLGDTIRAGQCGEHRQRAGAGAFEPEQVREY